jgi:hypothetical protein
MPKQWVSRTFRTCVPGIQATGFAGGQRFSLSRAMASKREIHRLRDVANVWPIPVRVTTANARCVSIRYLTRIEDGPG